MPIDYQNYPPNWKSEIRPAILERAKNRCEICNVPNYSVIFRGYLNVNKPDEKEVYQDAEGRVYDADNSVYLFTGFEADIFPLNGNPYAHAIKVVLTIAHLDHDLNNNDYKNLKALCQRCHNRYDMAYRKANRKKNKGQIELL